MVKTINQNYQDKYLADKRKRVIFKIAIWLAVVLAVISGITYFLFFSKLFNVREISIDNSSLVDNQEVRSVVDRYLEQKFFFLPRFSNIFFVNPDKLQSLISESFPQAKNIFITKKYFHRLTVALERKETAGIWCFKDAKCFYFDREGTAFDTAINSDGPLFLNIYDKTRAIEKPGEKVAGPDLINFILNARREVEKLKIDISKIIIPEEERFRVNVLTGEGWELYLNTEDDLQNQISVLNIFLTQKISPEKRSQLRYIDVRIPNRVYYK